MARWILILGVEERQTKEHLTKDRDGTEGGLSWDEAQAKARDRVQCQCV